MARRAGPYLQKEQLISVAADIADRDGWLRLNASTVARAVDRHVSTLYAHVDGIDDLRRLVTLQAMKELTEELEAASHGKRRRAALESLAQAARSFHARHPGRSAAIESVIDYDDEEMVAVALRLAAPTRAAFRSYGLNEEKAAHAHRAFSAALRGVTTGESHGKYRSRDVADTTMDEIVDLFHLALTRGKWLAEQPTR